MSPLDPWQIPLRGTTLIEASAGTGKTHTLTTLYLRLLVEEDRRPSQILVVTYTQAATAELRERVRDRIQQAIRADEADAASEAPDTGENENENGNENEPVAADAAARDRAGLRALARQARRRAQKTGQPDALRRALREFDEATIFTIHGFCQRTLQEHAFESGAAFDAELVEQSDPIERTLARDVWARLIDGEDPRLVEWLLVGAGQRWQFEPEPLHHDLIRILGADEEMPVLPDDSHGGGETDLEDAFAACREAWVEWAAAWRWQRADRVAWLLDPANLHQGTYKPAKLEKLWIPWLDQRAAWIAKATGSAAAGPQTTPTDPPATEDFFSPLPPWWQSLLPEKIAKGLKKKGVPREDELFEASARVEQASRAVERAFAARALGLRQRFVEEVRAQSRRRRAEKHLLFFDDLLSELRNALRGRKGERLAALLRERMPFALIDEFQDTDPVQYEIFHRVWHREPGEVSRQGLLLIGDPKQAIYSFRGADVFTYLRARTDAAREPFSLAVSYRSDPPLIHALNALFSRPDRPFGLDEIDFEPVAPRPGARSQLEAPGRSRAGLRVVMAEREQVASELGESVEGPLPLRFGRTELMDAFARDVAELLECGARIDGRPVVPSDIAVLCRKKKELARAREALVALGIPCVDRGDQDVFESREAWELVCVLRAMLHPGDAGLLRAALSTAAQGLDASAIAGLDDDGPERAAASERFAEYARLWSRSGLVQALETWRREEGVVPRLLALEDGERRVTNFLHLAELLQGIALERAPSRAGLVAWLERAIADEDVRREVGSEASLLRLERDDEAVSLVTLHRSKGLEYEIVYLPCLWEAPTTAGLPSLKSAGGDQARNPPVRFHDPQSSHRSLDLGGPDYAEHVEQAHAEMHAEQLRLLYVGLTRARRQCTVFWGAIGRGFAATPLAGLLDVPLEDAGHPADDTQARPAPESLEERAKRIAGWTDARWRQAWGEVAQVASEAGASRTAEEDAAGGEATEIEAISIESARFGARARWQAPRPEPTPLAPPAPAPRLPGVLRTTSFSGLVRGALRGGTSGPGAIGRDLDAEVEDLRHALRHGEDESPTTSDLAGGMDAFPRGAQAGTLLHSVLESVRFDALDPERVDALARHALAQNGLDSALDVSVRHVVESVAWTPLRRAPSPLRLADLARGQLRSEVEFTLAAPGGPPGGPAGGPASGSFEPGTLATVLARAPAGSPLARYAPRLARLDWAGLRGYLRGFIDAVFCDGERYFVIDYKSNHLGASQADYRPDRLLAPMLEHNYVLQYLIYCVALDRHLRCTLVDYDYEAHFGGAYYLFLRGLAREHEPDCGIFFDRPEAATLRAVSALLAGEIEVTS